MKFNETNFWIQIHNLPLTAMKNSTIEEIGNLIGKVMEVEEKDGGIKWGAFMRVRVKVNLKKPLMRGCMLKTPNIGEVWAQFKYERLPRLCRWCGILGYNEYGCANREESGVGEYGDLRAENDSMVNMQSKIYEPKRVSSSPATNKTHDKNNTKDVGGTSNEGERMEGSHIEKRNETIREDRGIGEKNKKNYAEKDLIMEEVLESTSPLTKQGESKKNGSTSIHNENDEEGDSRGMKDFMERVGNREIERWDTEFPRK